ncbi:DNA polymerase [Bienertia sinuspersici]
MLEATGRTTFQPSRGSSRIYEAGYSTPRWYHAKSLKALLGALQCRHTELDLRTSLALTIFSSYYDVNSLYPFIMKEYPMRGGAPAYVVCPTSLSKPFLSYRGKENLLLFPTGDLGYTVIPISGYLFYKMESPFKEYVNSLKEWKGTSCRAGDEALLLDSGMRITELFNSGAFKDDCCRKRSHLCLRREPLLRLLIIR